MIKKASVLFSAVLLFTLLFSACSGSATPTQAPTEEVVVEPTAPPAEEKKLILATTTSTQDSGLLDYLLPIFKEDTGIQVEVIAVGSGQALKLGEDGNADVLLVHSVKAETEYMGNGHGVRREPVMYNDYVIIGPENDPAGIKGMTVAADAFKKIADAGATFISRGDDSGTHVKEQAIWKAAGLEPAGNWYISAGASMGEVLNMASEKQAYTLSDRGTFLARVKEGLKLPVLVEGDKIMFNPYHVITVNPQKSPNIKADLANQFLEWIISLSVQEKIGQFGTADFGQPLFVADSNPWRMSKGTPTEAP